MKKLSFFLLTASLFLLQSSVLSQSLEKPVLQQTDLNWSSDLRAGFAELQIPSGGSLVQGFIYTANGSNPHPTLLLLHGYPGNERNLDLA